MTQQQKQQFAEWLTNNLQLTSKSNVELIVRHVENYFCPSLELKPPASEPEKWEDMNEEFKALYPIPLEDFGKDFVGTLQILTGYQETSDNYIKLRMVANTIKKIINNGYKFPPYAPASESRERFKMPEDSDIVKAAIVFNDGKMDKEALTNMVGLVDFVIARLYENGDIKIPSSKE